mmetsp:Transcript_73228/g.129859  ORF Transcript_73228/g.129859 Transcript_73228/m.129859 type:complete len:259 (-) Transcript_73228:138-914(-)
MALGRSSVDLSEITIEPEGNSLRRNQHIDLLFENNNEFYNKFDELLNSNAPFSIRITEYGSPRFFPSRLTELLQAWPDSTYGKKWNDAYESFGEDTPANQALRSFKQPFGKSFENPVNERWEAFEDVACQRLGGEPPNSTMGAMMAPLPLGGFHITTVSQVATKFIGSLWYAPQYAWSWARHQDKKRLSYVTGLTAAGAGTGAVAGPVGSVVAGVVALTTAVATSGNRTGDISVSKDHPDSDTARSPHKVPVAVIIFR